MTNTAESFKTHVEVRGPNDCWPWRRALQKGYGRYKVAGKSWRVHAFALFLATGMVQGWALHTCDNRACCNPAHLYWGDHDQNMQDMVERGGMAGKNHPRSRLTEADVEAIRLEPRTHGYRQRLAAKYSVSPGTISDVVGGRRRKPKVSA